MKPVINIDWQVKANELEKLVGVREAAYSCGVAEYTFKRLMEGTPSRMGYDFGVLLLWQLETAQ
jgi:hypothetical protein